VDLKSLVLHQGKTVFAVAVLHQLCKIKFRTIKRIQKIITTLFTLMATQWLQMASVWVYFKVLLLPQENQATTLQGLINNNSSLCIEDTHRLSPNGKGHSLKVWTLQPMLVEVQVLTISHQVPAVPTPWWQELWWLRVTPCDPNRCSRRTLSRPNNLAKPDSLIDPCSASI